jgi:hypothetical protein
LRTHASMGLQGENEEKEEEDDDDDDGVDDDDDGVDDDVTQYKTIFFIKPLATRALLNCSYKLNPCNRCARICT